MQAPRTKGKGQRPIKATVVYVHQEKLGLGEYIRHLKDIVDILTAEEFQNHIEYLSKHQS